MITSASHAHARGAGVSGTAGAPLCVSHDHLSRELKAAASLNRIGQPLLEHLFTLIGRQLEEVHAGGRGGQPPLLVGRTMHAKGGQQVRKAQQRWAGA